MVYGGPHVQMVSDSWGLTSDLTAQYLAGAGSPSGRWTTGDPLAEATRSRRRSIAKWGRSRSATRSRGWRSSPRHWPEVDAGARRRHRRELRRLHDPALPDRGPRRLPGGCRRRARHRLGRLRHLLHRALHGHPGRQRRGLSRVVGPDARRAVAGRPARHPWHARRERPFPPHRATDLGLDRRLEAVRAARRCPTSGTRRGRSATASMSPSGSPRSSSRRWRRSRAPCSTHSRTSVPRRGAEAQLAPTLAAGTGGATALPGEGGTASSRRCRFSGFLGKAVPRPCHRRPRLGTNRPTGTGKDPTHTQAEGASSKTRRPSPAWARRTCHAQMRPRRNGGSSLPNRPSNISCQRA